MPIGFLGRGRELLSGGHAILAPTRLLHLVRVLEQAACAHPANGCRRCLLSAAASSDLAQPALHVAHREEGAAVGVERLEGVLLDAAQEVQRERVYSVALVAGEVPIGRKKRRGKPSDRATRRHRASPRSGRNATVRTLSCVREREPLI